MCGFYLCLSKRQIKNDLSKIEDTLKARGLDFTGISSGKYKDYFYCSLHCWLSIIDLTANSNQPCCNENGILVFNAEKHNYKELEKRYNLKLPKDETVSDTKVLWALLESFGVSILNELRGIFSFVFLDKRNAKLIPELDHSEVIEACKNFLNYKYNNGKFISAVIVYINWRLKNGGLQ
jgi:asparagine synthase (glutamine-hydrolysing)